MDNQHEPTTHRTRRLAHSSTHRHERRPAYRRPLARDRPPRHQNPSCGSRTVARRSVRPSAIPGSRVTRGLGSLGHFVACRVPWAVATSGRPASAQPMLALLQLAPEVPVITRDQVERAKPDPDLFLAAAKRLRVPPNPSLWETASGIC